MSDLIRVIRLSPDGDPQTGFTPWEPIAHENVTVPGGQDRRHRFYVGDRKMPGQIRVGIWEATAYTERLENYPKDEFMYVIEGSCIIIEEDGNEERFEAGESFFMPAGFNGYWKQDEPMKKYFMVFDAYDSGD
ncbi:cupin domain-containing protein [Ruegeria sp.]|uniref:cupin domain-containing protein n=1 Tax=Ruegeria sp. TaxID=1879320 RepID=UPI0023232094|nr:cupin domain-containing protein [Ruegeria sp.]MDA7965813.1 cupin domain-containing protein [Ruegeria sp.]